MATAAKRRRPPPKPAPEPPAPRPADAVTRMGRDWQPTARAAAACPVCRAFGPIPPLLADGGHVLHRCPTCRACFYADRTMPDYEREEEPGFYQQLYLEQNGSIHHMLGTLFLVETEGVDSLLDVGCGFGFSVDMAAKSLGWRAVGIDPSHYAREGARLLGADIRKAYLTETTELGAPFGLVVASEVIEHVPDPDAFLLILRRWLQPGRTLVLTTPDADAVQPGAGEAELVSILAVGTHLVLFSAAALEVALSRAGFAHVEVTRQGNTLVALASDAPLRRMADSASRHIHAYQDYLRHLVESAPVGTPLWNGAAGRLLQLRAESAPLEEMHALFARVAEAWREGFGIDLARLRLPGQYPEQVIAEAAVHADAAKRLMWRMGAEQPVNLATVLFCRAILEARRPGRLPEEVLRWARPAHVHAVQTARILMGATMVDLDLAQTAWRARLMIVDALTEAAPEMEIELLVGLATVRPANLSQLTNAPPGMLVARVAPCFTRLAQEQRLDEALCLEPWLRNLDVLAPALVGQPIMLFLVLFGLGSIYLAHLKRADSAANAFERLASETAARSGTPRAQEFHAAALNHLAMVQQLRIEQRRASDGLHDPAVGCQAAVWAGSSLLEHDHAVVEVHRQG